VGWLYEELIEQAGPKSENEIRSAAKRWRKQAEPILRELTALRLITDRERATIPIAIVPGLPKPLAKLDQMPAEAGQALLGIYRPVIDQFIESGEAIEQLLERLLALAAIESDDFFQQKADLGNALILARRLRDKAGKTPFLPGLFQYDEDILGSYSFSLRDSKRGKIEIYWGVIGAVARLLGCSASSLTGVALIHELAHAYTHLGADIEGRRWRNPAFAHSEQAVKEGLAQYYTCWVARRFHDRQQPALLEAFEALLKVQSGFYHTHLDWLERFSPEMVRAAMLQVRLHRNGVDLDVFQKTLQAAADQLSENSSPQLRFFEE
jgi:hypothetical protein